MHRLRGATPFVVICGCTVTAMLLDQMLKFDARIIFFTEVTLAAAPAPPRPPSRSPVPLRPRGHRVDPPFPCAAGTTRRTAVAFTAARTAPLPPRHFAAPTLDPAKPGRQRRLSSLRHPRAPRGGCAPRFGCQGHLPPLRLRPASARAPVARRATAWLGNICRPLPPHHPTTSAAAHTARAPPGPRGRLRPALARHLGHTQGGCSSRRACGAPAALCLALAARVRHCCSSRPAPAAPTAPPRPRRLPYGAPSRGSWRFLAPAPHSTGPSRPHRPRPAPCDG